MKATIFEVLANLGSGQSVALVDCPTQSAIDLAVYAQAQSERGAFPNYYVTGGGRIYAHAPGPPCECCGGTPRDAQIKRGRKLAEG